MSIWDKHPNYTDDELRLLVKAASTVLLDNADRTEELDPGLLEMGTRSAARELSSALKERGADVPVEDIHRLLSDEATARTASLAALDAIRTHPALAERVAEEYDNQRNKMLGVEILLAAALLVVAVKVKRIVLSKGVMIEFYKSADAVKTVIATLASSDGK
jgi:hypothetical protein